MSVLDSLEDDLLLQDSEERLEYPEESDVEAGDSDL